MVFDEDSGRLRGGLLPVVFEVSRWKEWLPFCDGVVPIKEFATCGLYHLRMKILFLSFDNILFITVAGLQIRNMKYKNEL